MGIRVKMNGDEHDALTGWRKVLGWRAGQRSAIKRGYRRKLRRMLKKLWGGE